MATYLLTWNPKNWNGWTEDLSEQKDRFGRGETITWSCVSGDIEPGDRVFLLRQGREPRGLFASGVAVSGPVIQKHWDGSGRKKQYVEVQFDVFLNPATDALFTRASLDRGVLGEMHWDTQSSGIRIPEKIAAALLTRWKTFVRASSADSERRERGAVEGAAREALVMTRGRSRALREQALVNSKGVCEVCQVDFGSILGGRGRRALQVHHSKQLSLRTAPAVTRLSELAVVCANCHCLLHLDPAKTLQVAELRRMLKQDKTRR